MSELRLRTFDWSKLIEEHFLESMLVGMLGAVIGIVLIEQIQTPPWVIRSWPLSLLCLVLAFTRLWRTVREEHEWADVWDAVLTTEPMGATSEAHVRDAVIEVPYVLSLMILPFATINVQAFGLCLLVYYICDTNYTLTMIERMPSRRVCLQPRAWRDVSDALTAMLASELPRATTLRRTVRRVFWIIGTLLGVLFYQPLRAPLPIDRLTVVRMFERFIRQHAVSISLLLILGIVLWTCVAFGWRDAAVASAAVVFSVLLLMELLLSPAHSIDVPFLGCEHCELEHLPPTQRAALWPLSRDAALDQPTIDALTRLHEDAFGPDEQQITAAQMLAMTGRDGCMLCLLTLDRHLAGYAFVQQQPRQRRAFLWYIAVDPQHRGSGIGSAMVRALRTRMLEAMPWLTMLLLESREPDDLPDPAERRLAERRLDFYARLGGQRVRGIDYAVPAADQPDRLCRYVIFAFPMRAALDADAVRDAVRSMIEQNLPAGHAQRRTSLASLTALTIEEPTPQPAQ